MSRTLQYAVQTPLRYAAEPPKKASGATYTPELLADFVAEQILATAQFNGDSAVRVLDPAVGDGALLAALARRIPEGLRERLLVTGFDTNTVALEAASKRLQGILSPEQLELSETDFLSYVLNFDGVFASPSNSKFDVVIANPPYVRTQVMGASEAQRLSRSFGLTGRVDLYYPFLLGIARVLAPDGVAGIITSNRFMTTKSGQAVRRAVLSNFDVLHTWDLGDTKLFDAAVLPAVILAKGTHSAAGSDTPTLFTSIYETQEGSNTTSLNPLSALNAIDGAVVEIPDGRRFKVKSGVLDNGGNCEGVWRVATTATDSWLATVNANTRGTFGQIGKIRVGVKSTADKVFIRHDWDSIPTGRPELLRPLITRRNARQFRAAAPKDDRHLKEILYPHEADANGRRKAVDLANYPKAKHYLEAHRDKLEARTYVIEAGRQWYEIWVPHDPSAWGRPKLVFPDISETPVFWMDTDGGVVNGECYWLQSEKAGNEELLWLALAVANSTFIVSFYDHCFSNKLYAGRRRFITQYVEKFPLPDPNLESSKAIIETVKRVYDATPSPLASELAEKLNRMVWNAFGLRVEEIAR